MTVGELPQVGGAILRLGSWTEWRKRTEQHHLPAVDVTQQLLHTLATLASPPGWNTSLTVSQRAPLCCLVKALYQNSKRETKRNSRFGIRQNENWKDALTDSTC